MNIEILRIYEDSKTMMLSCLMNEGLLFRYDLMFWIGMFFIRDEAKKSKS